MDDSESVTDNVDDFVQESKREYDSHLRSFFNQ